MFKMGCSMARKILGPGAGSSSNGQPTTEFQGASSASDSAKKTGNKSGDELGDFSKLEEDPRLPLNVRQIFKITKSWKAIARTMSKTGTAMFLNLFEQNQDLFYLFDRFQHLKGRELHESMELREHAATVMSTLDQSINSLSDYDNFISYLHSIGQLHRKVPGFKREFFWKIEQPFMMAVKQTLDERCNETIEQIYKIAIKLIIETIADGYGQDADASGILPGNDGGGQSGASSGGGGGAGSKSGSNQAVAPMKDKSAAPNENKNTSGASGGERGKQMKATIDALAQTTRAILTSKTSGRGPINAHAWRQLLDEVSELLQDADDDDDDDANDLDQSLVHASPEPTSTSTCSPGEQTHDDAMNNEFTSATSANEARNPQVMGQTRAHCLNRNDTSQRRRRRRRHWLKICSSSSSSSSSRNVGQVCANFNETPDGNCDSARLAPTSEFQGDEITSERRQSKQTKDKQLELNSIAGHDDDDDDDDNSTNDSTATNETPSRHDEAMRRRAHKQLYTRGTNENVLRFLHEQRNHGNQLDTQEAELVRLLLLINELSQRRRRHQQQQQQQPHRQIFQVPTPPPPPTVVAC